MSEEKAQEVAEKVGGRVSVDNTAYVVESAFVGNVYVVKVEREEA